jgi:phenylpyruvate tautomerase PptA (4-oxalocrotonate tautomerase family)
VPLVHIHVIEGQRDADQVRIMCDVIQQVMRDDFAAPENDRYQLVSAHPAGSIVAEDSGLGLSRTDQVVLVEITQQGRSRDQKVVMYASLARALQEKAGLHPQDLIISVTENTREDWSFGEGRAQFLDGGLP